jgi:hypothetical protein
MGERYTHDCRVDQRATHPDPMMARQGEEFRWCHMEDAEPCDWCGKIGRLKAFYYKQPNGRRRATEGLFCTRNCWNQVHRNT